jgi:hypothetical protein
VASYTNIVIVGVIVALFFSTEVPSPHNVIFDTTGSSRLIVDLILLVLLCHYTAPNFFTVTSKIALLLQRY